MYEISLVPDVKSELLQKQKLRNLIIFVCLIVAAVCAGIIVILLLFSSGQALTISNQENEIGCRVEGRPKNKNAKCDSDKGVGVLQFKNVNEILTIQDQMKSIGTLNENKVKFSRVFGLLDVILPDGRNSSDTVLISELTGDVSQNIITFDAQGFAANNIGYHTLISFKKGAEKTYFDYGRYMRLDENGDFVEIPSYCISETVEKGIIYGIYKKGAPGCEAPLIQREEKSEEENKEESSEEKNSNDAENAEESEEAEGSEESEAESSESEEKKEEVKKSEVKLIKIRRTYKDQNDLNEYKNGQDQKNELDKDAGRYYFESACLQYTEKGEFDEEATIKECPVLAEDGLYIGSEGYGKGSEDQLVLSFSATLTINDMFFKAGNRHMQVIGPSRQNVTDSYVQIRDMFTEKAHDVQLENMEDK